ncbi:MAG: PQQ-binding-like beta-propeller repeat protein [Prevotellaceae bacterium]|nr:PQQ-binding-like beta-propeller repeat protein [Prevotellaceae bacterium]
MKSESIVTAATVVAALAFAGAVAWWHVYPPKRELAVQAPGADGRPPGSARRVDDVRIGEFFMRYGEASASDRAAAGGWQCFRGAQASNIVRTPEKIEAPQEDYPVLWRVSTGEGHASPAIFNGLVYFLDYDEALSADALRCFSLESGRELWRRWYRVPLKRNHGFSRTSPAVADGYVITMGPQGHLMCCDPLSGELRWSLDVQKEFKTEVPFWYTGQCPRVDGGTLVVAPAGEEVLLAGIDCATGSVVWTTPNTPGFKMSHSSVMPMTIEGKKTYVYVGVGGVCGVSAEAEDRGALLWSAAKWQPSVVAPSPLQLSSGAVFLVAGYGTGGALLRVGRAGQGWSAAVAEQYKPSEGLSSEQQTPILYRDMIISVMPKDGGGLRGKLVCYSPSDLHSPVWSSGADERFGLGPYMVINDKLFVLKDDGELYVYEILPRSMRLLKRQRVMDGVDAWGPMAYANGRLIVRDAHEVACLKIN